MQWLSIYLQCAFIATELVGVDAQHDQRFRERVTVCANVAKHAIAHKIDPWLAVSVSWSETRLTHAPTPNKYNCVGPMQIKYHYWCNDELGQWSPTHPDGVLEGCDTAARGAFALSYYLQKYRGDRVRALCAYGWGTCDTEQRRAYVSRTLRNQVRIRTLLRTLP